MIGLYLESACQGLLCSSEHTLASIRRQALSLPLDPSKLLLSLNGSVFGEGST